jgi:hypothetical protein
MSAAIRTVKPGKREESPDEKEEKLRRDSKKSDVFESPLKS